MKLNLDKEKKKKTRKILKWLKTQEELWKKELEDAIEKKSNSPLKYYKGLKMRVKFAEDYLKSITDKIEKTEKILKQGYIDV